MQLHENSFYTELHRKRKHLRNILSLTEIHPWNFFLCKSTDYLDIGGIFEIMARD